MGTTAEKLAYLNDTKTAIKDAIVAKGVDVTDGTTFRQYADKIAGISGVKTATANITVSGDLKSLLFIDSNGSLVNTTTGRLGETEIQIPGIIAIALHYPSPSSSWSITGDASLIAEYGDVVGYFDYNFIFIHVYGNCSISI